MPTYLVTFPALPVVTAQGRDAVDALAAAIQSAGSMPDVIQLCADTAPEVIKGAQAGESSIRAVVAWWHAQHPEIVVTEANPWTLAASDPTRWHEISRAKADGLRDVMPPIDFTGGFAVSEAIRHDGGAAVYLCVVQVRGKWWARESTLRGVSAALLEMRGAA